MSFKVRPYSSQFRIATHRTASLPVTTTIIEENKDQNIEIDEETGEVIPSQETKQTEIQEQQPGFHRVQPPQGHHNTHAHSVKKVTDESFM